MPPPRCRHDSLEYGNSVLAGLPVYLSTLFADSSLYWMHEWSLSYVASTTSLTLLLVYMHWLHVPGSIQFKIAVLTYTIIHGTAPRYLGPLVCVSNLLGQRCLRSASTDRLIAPSLKLSTNGIRTLKVAAAQIWNGLPEDVTSSPTLPIFP